MGWFVLLRARTHWLLITAAFLTVVLATSVLASLTAFTSAVGDAGLSRSLEHHLASRSLVDVRSPLGADDTRSTDKAVRDQLADLFPGQSVKTEASTQSARYTLPADLPQSGTGAASSEPDFTILASFERARMELAEGEWPATAAGGEHAAVQAMLSEPAARLLGLAPGDELELTSPQKDAAPVRVELSGVYRAVDGTHPYWRLDPLEGQGAQTLSFTTYGPFVVDESAFATGTVPAAEGRWQADADFSSLTTAQLADVRARTSAAVSSFGVDGAEVTTELPEVLDSLERSLLVSRSTLLIGALQLVLLAGLALLLVARLLAAERTEENALLRARGGSSTGLGTLAAGEALLLTLPAALLAPWTVTPLVGWLSGNGALADAGVQLVPERTAAVWWVTAATALLCACAMTLPALRTPERGGRRRAAALRGGLDIALVVLAVLAYLQLLRRQDDSGVLNVGTGGPLAIDPVLVAAPALALLAGTVLALRLLPPLTRLGERLAARSRVLTAPLAGWQLSRRPTRVAAPATLLVLAVSMGVFSLGQGASWERSQSDQADFRTGADVLVTGSSLPRFGQGGVYQELPDVVHSAPVARSEFQVAEGRNTQLLATDTRHLDELIPLRDDLADAPFATLLDTGEDKRRGPSLDFGSVEDRWQFKARLSVSDMAGKPVGEPGPASQIHAVVEDRHGVPYRVAVGRVQAGEEERTHTVDLGALAGEGAYAGPLHLVGLEASAEVPTDEPQRHQLSLSGLTGISDHRWEGEVDTTNHAQLALPTKDGEPKVRGVTTPSDGQLRVELSTGLARTQDGATGAAPGASTPVNTVRLTADRATDSTPPSAVVTDAYLEASGAEVGDEVKVQVAGTEITVRITGSVRALPTAQGVPGEDGGAVLLDLSELEYALSTAGGRPAEQSDWWLATKPGKSRQVAAELRDRADVESVTSRTEVAEQLRGDPLGAGPRTALTATAFAAVLLAATGFAASVTGAVRERGREFAVLRALGASRRQLARVIGVEHVVLVALSLAVGTALGALLLRMVLPLIVLSADAGQVTPPLLIQLPLGQLALMLAAMAVVPLLAVAVIALRRGASGGVEQAQGER